MPFTFRLKNYGNVDLNNVQVRDDLALVFDGALGFSVVPGTLSASGPTVNPGYTGTLRHQAARWERLRWRVGASAIGERHGQRDARDQAEILQLRHGHRAASAAGSASDLSQSGSDPDPTATAIRPSRARIRRRRLSSTPPPPISGSLKTGQSDTVVVGQNVTYTLSVTNDGPAGAPGVTVTDLVPAIATLISASPSQGSWRIAEARDVQPGTLGVGAGDERSRVVVRGRRRGAPAQSGRGGDGRTERAARSESEGQLRQYRHPRSPRSPTWRSRRRPPPIQAALNGQVTFTMTLQNNGPSIATGVTLSDADPVRARLRDGDAEPGVRPARRVWSASSASSGRSPSAAAPPSR